MDLAIAIFKYAGMLLTGVFGVLGLLVKFKDEDGKITRHGRAALFLIVLSTIVAVASHSLELHRSQAEKERAAEARSRETLDEVRRTQRTVLEITRSLHPIKDLRIGYFIRVPMDHESVAAYRKRFEDQLARILPQLNTKSPVLGVFESARVDGKIASVTIGPFSPLFPAKPKEKHAHQVLRYSEIELHFFRKPIDPYSHERISDRHTGIQPDLAVRVSAGLGESGLSGSHEVTYEMSDRVFRFFASRIDSDPKYWESTGEIVSIPDLAGAQMFVFLPSVMVSGESEVDRVLPEIRKGFELETLILSMSGGRELWFRRAALTRYSDSRGLPVYVYTFPPRWEDLRKLRP